MVPAAYPYVFDHPQYPEHTRGQPLTIFSLDITPLVEVTSSSKTFPIAEYASGPIKNAALSCSARKNNRSWGMKWLPGRNGGVLSGTNSRD